MSDTPSFTQLTDLAARDVGGAVVWANDEFFGEKESLIRPEPPTFSPATFGHKGQVVDGWETRRRRPGGPGVEGTEHDSAIVRLGLPGVIRGVTIDTAFFLGNYPPHARVEAASVPGFPTPADLLAAEWTEIVPTSPLSGGSEQHFEAEITGRRFTHVRLAMIPDGGIARFRVYGEAVPDPVFLAGVPVDLAALTNGARIVAASNMFFSAPENLIKPAESRVMGEGWETARRRDDAGDWIEVRLVAQGVPAVIEIDTANYKGNAPDHIVLLGADRPGQEAGSNWFEVIAQTRMLPDYKHRFRLEGARPVTHLRLEVRPDGGVARLRAFGSLTDAGLTAVRTRWAEHA
ncbi:allantoicase [Catenulispora acidiphila DSM 44928]|uniref:Probable allantoicase n=1 Tax=Catenulispora acidiphila (strain DSM 44928 / JCM 14897 / NBRC 102108 / NRRL B-24433 / ID139908) TaxID=479433 RepID=C7PZS1_CATAD|nr:allantoicase [Catenulispora acidiphila]ACU73586.1 allantoicase [Catenulispora acidiphila DSM 44928]